MSIKQALRSGARRVAPGVMGQRARRYERTLRARQGIPQLAQRLQPVVRYGPFAGLRYPPERLDDVDAPAAKLLGTYESELAHIFQPRVARFVDVGCADGYYAVGMARNGARVVAYDIARSARELCSTLATFNRVSVQVRGRFGRDEAEQVGDALLLCDIEGAERTLFSRKIIDALRLARVVIEVHEDPTQALGTHLREAFSGSHSSRVIRQQPRTPPAEIEGWPRHEIDLALTEHRPSLMHWLELTPRHDP
jgi:SAM-dependent methyltransferase